ncbi:MAG: HAD family hydrolase [Salibacteraceae bacterium]
MKIIYFIIISGCLILSSCSSEPKSTQQNQVEQKEQVAPILSSWNEGETKTSIIDFVNRTTDKSNRDFIEVKDRIAVFDNDGTLWAEQPSYFQLIFALDKIKALAPEHPEWSTEQPFKAVIEDDTETMKSFHTKELLTLVMASHTGQTHEEFQEEVIAWNNSTKHPRFEKPFTDLVYQPMLELLDYLQQNDFKTYIVSGGGVYFMRALVTEVYNIPEEQIIGTTIVTNFVSKGNTYVITRAPEIEFINDKEGKSVNINKIIGKKPVFCAGNSDGDLAMMQYTSTNTLPYFNLYVHHTDSEREWAYDSLSHIGRLKKGFTEAQVNGWTIANMQEDWKVIFPFESDSEK